MPFLPGISARLPISTVIRTDGSADHVNHRRDDRGDCILPTRQFADTSPQLMLENHAYLFGKGIGQNDSGLTKDIHTGGMEFRFEAFNATNTPVFGIPVHDFTDPDFGSVLSTGNIKRQFQFPLEFLFLIFRPPNKKIRAWASTPLYAKSP
jgi:hypothetical protein